MQENRLALKFNFTWEYICLKFIMSLRSYTHSPAIPQCGSPTTTGSGTHCHHAMRDQECECWTLQSESNAVWALSTIPRYPATTGCGTHCHHAMRDQECECRILHQMLTGSQ